MRRLLMLFAACIMFVACGGSKDGKAQLTMEERCDQYAKLRMELSKEAYAIEGDFRADPRYQELKKLNDENDASFKEWLYSLPQEEQDKAVDYLQESYKKYECSGFPN